MAPWPQLNAWSETIPVSDPNPGWQGAVVGAPCPICQEPLAAGETVYGVVELPRVDGREQYVCWRHVRGDDGPLR